MNRTILNPSSHFEPCATVEEGIQLYLPDLVRRARCLTRNRAQAEELVQDTVERALRYRKNYRNDTHARAWLMRVMHNLFISQQRRRNVERRVVDRVAVDPNSWTLRPASTPHSGMSRPVLRAMAALPEQLAEVVRLVDLYDYSYQEAASFQGVPIGTVMSRLHRGRGRLARHLRPDMDRGEPDKKARSEAPRATISSTSVRAA